MYANYRTNYHCTLQLPGLGILYLAYIKLSIKMMINVEKLAICYMYANKGAKLCCEK